MFSSSQSTVACGYRPMITRSASLYSASVAIASIEPSASACSAVARVRFQPKTRLSVRALMVLAIEPPIRPSPAMSTVSNMNGFPLSFVFYSVKVYNGRQGLSMKNRLRLQAVSFHYFFGRGLTLQIRCHSGVIRQTMNTISAPARLRIRSSTSHEPVPV